MENLCGICGGSGLVISGGVAAPCRCARERYFINRLKQSGLPPLMLECSFEKFNFKFYKSKGEERGSHYNCARLAYDACKEFVKGFSENPKLSGLLISGPVGSGKTYLVSCIARALLERGKSLYFAVVPDLLDNIKATYDQGRQQGQYSEKDIMDEVKETPLLVLDDLGAHNYTDWTRNKLYSIINYRLNNKLPVLITTNINLEDMEQYLGERTTSRILQMCVPYKLHVEVDIRVAQRH